MLKKVHPDILGLALKDFYLGNSNAQILIHSRDFENDSIEVSYYFRALENMPEIEIIALDRCMGKVLDIGAGAGSHALHLQNAGVDVTAMDISKGACEIMKNLGLNKVRNENALNYRGEKFDTILMMMNGIGIVENLNGLRKFFKFLPSLLKPGGKLLFDSTNLIYLFTEDDGSVWIDLNENYYGEVTFKMEFGNYISPEFGWLYVDYDIVASISQELGYKSELIFEAENFHYLCEVQL
jgi:SAM-dependent methyltransferase